MRVLDLFSGIGGFSYGLQLAGTVCGEAFETVAFCEIDHWCRRVLAKNFPGVPIFEDVTKLRGADVGPVDVICGGYPCQPFSLAGERKGQEDDRHLWPEFNRLVAELRPRWVIGENVAGHISMGLDSVLSDLEDQGYTCRAFVIPACAVDARHRRDRVWIVGHAAGAGPHAASQPGLCGEKKSRGPRHAKPERRSEALADTASEGRHPSRGASETILRPKAVQRSAGCSRGSRIMADTARGGMEGDRPARLKISQAPAGEGIFGCDSAGAVWNEWPAEPGICRVADGIPRRVDRIKGLGNAVVPQVVMMIGWAILAAEAEWRAAA